ncbi:helix-turn-helix domain-containing protein [Formosa sp. PL04]|uniref:helix-turn-helix transcriptional regulator n=1 Tax=Formosa sp. PL04 TaxID=3081755 RepID=UPI002981FB05|nr:helix-turn-helix domain-containing protein [Formosa sp. PL04]MDW5289203.1 helix-turn-helix domain-containing protein [Formosa sp. PL04]
METQSEVITLLEAIRNILSHDKKVLNVNDLAVYTGLSKSKIYKLTHLKQIPMGNNPHIRQKFFDKDAIDEWLLGNPDLSDEYLEQQFDDLLHKNKRLPKF